MKNIILLLGILLLFSCQTRYIEKEIPVEIIKKEYITNIQHDSIYCHDSIDRYTKGDTVFINKIKYLYKQKIVNDTIIRIDTIPKVLKTTEIVELNRLHNYQKILIGFGILSLLLVLIKIIIVLKK